MSFILTRGCHRDDEFPGGVGVLADEPFGFQVDQFFGLDSGVE